MKDDKTDQFLTSELHAEFITFKFSDESDKLTTKYVILTARRDQLTSVILPEFERCSSLPLDDSVSQVEWAYIQPADYTLTGYEDECRAKILIGHINPTSSWSANALFVATKFAVVTINFFSISAGEAAGW